MAHPVGITASQVSTKAPTGGSSRSLASRLDDSTPAPEDFGAVGDGIADDTAAVQKAVRWAVENKRSLRGSGRAYGISAPVIIPQLFDYTSRSVALDFAGSRFRMLADTTLFTSGWQDGANLVTNWGTAADSHYSQGLELGGFLVDAAAPLTAATLRIQDWHQGSKIRNIASLVATKILESANNFYTDFADIRSLFSGAKTGPRFVFSGAHNLNKLSGLVAANATVGYQFNGPVTALQLEGMSLEGQTTGLEFNASVYDMAISHSYLEAFSDTAIAFKDYVYNAVLRNNYVNFLGSATSYLLSYAPLPANNIRVSACNQLVNMPSVANIIKNREDVYGVNVVIERAKDAAASLSDLLVDNAAVGRNVDWYQRKRLNGIVANVVNDTVPGNYSGRYSTGYSAANGFEWINNGNNTLTVRTRVTRNFVQLVYVNITVAHSAGPTIIRGLFVGDLFFEFTGTGLVASTKLTAGAFGGYMQIDGGIFFNTSVTGCTGEIRML